MKIDGKVLKELCFFFLVKESERKEIFHKTDHIFFILIKRGFSILIGRGFLEKVSCLKRGYGCFLSNNIQDINIYEMYVKQLLLK